MIVRVLEQHLDRSLSMYEIEQAIKEEWGSCSKRCLEKALTKVMERETVVEHAESNYKLAPAQRARLIRRQRRRARPARLTGYNLFVRERMNDRTSGGEDASITDRMSAIATAWHALSAEDQETINQRARAINQSLAESTSPSTGASED